ncbi:MAG: hypothetical protein IIA07_06010 [Proteobacteria bacterium]|nr:hypothetical protein [Pseudomonadota bacterium]
MKALIILLFGLAVREADSDGSEHGQQRAPKRQGRRDFMLDFLRDLISKDSSLFKIFNLTRDASTRPIYLREDPCTSTLAIRPDFLPSLTYQVGQHEKNVNQCNSERRVAHGNGRRPTPL